MCYPTKLQHASSASGQDCALSPHSLIAWPCDLTPGRRRVWVLAHLTLELRKTVYPFNNSASSSAKRVMEESLHIRLVFLNYFNQSKTSVCLPTAELVIFLHPLHTHSFLVITSTLSINPGKAAAERAPVTFSSIRPPFSAGLHFSRCSRN